MVKMWCIGAAVILMQVVLISARDCSNLDNISNCNDCIRCGGEWCKDSAMESQCTRSMTDSWCPRHKERLRSEEPIQEVGDLLSVKHSERTVFVGKQDMLLIHYKSAAELPVNIKILNTTQNEAFLTTPYTNCKNGHCKTSVEVMPLTDFCSEDGRTTEHVNLQVSIEGLSEEATVKYKVPCACECAEKAERMSRRCKGRGDYSCGRCSCHDGWAGQYCEKKVCKVSGRGDNPCSHPLRGNVECSGNGECDSECQICKCYTDRIGSQYFDQESQCADICLTVSECEECLRDPVLGKCAHCGFPLIYREFNDTIVEERDYLNRTIWIKCNETLLGEYYVEYFAMRDERGDIYFMIPPSDTTVGAIGGGGGVNITVPIVLGLLAVVAAGSLAAGYVLWKNRVPPVPLADPMYTNIDAEDSTGENPLYKPPTSSFKNPTYGKW